MPVNVDAAQRFIFANARLLDRHRLAILAHDGPVARVLTGLRAYRNDDGGFGHALEPDVRAPTSELTSTLHALEVLAEVNALDDPMVADAAEWAATVAEPDGGVPFVLPTAAGYPHAPWMKPVPGGSHLTFGFAGILAAAGQHGVWLDKATEWCWSTLARPEDMHGYLVKYALDFLDHVSEQEHALSAIEHLRTLIDSDGCLPVPGGIENERLTPLKLCPRPTRHSRTLFSEANIQADLDRLEREQQEDGGWTFDWLGWSPGQSVEWRGSITLEALIVLKAHGRIASGSLAAR